jgi:hypothetical protein
MADGIGGTGVGPHKIEIILDPARGVVESIKPIGVAGPHCQALTAPFERLFAGGKTDTKLPEFYAQEPIKQTQKLGGGI